MYMGLQSDENWIDMTFMIGLLEGSLCSQERTKLPVSTLPESTWINQRPSGSPFFGQIGEIELFCQDQNQQFSSDCRPMYIYPRCCQRGPKLFRGDVWVDFYLIYSSSGASWWWSWWASTSRQRCGHVECPPFQNYLSWMDGWSWNLLEMVL